MDRAQGVDPANEREARMQRNRPCWRSVGVPVALGVLVLAVPGVRATEIYVSPSEHDDRLHIMASRNTSIWDNLEEAAAVRENGYHWRLMVTSKQVLVHTYPVTLQYVL